MNRCRDTRAFTLVELLVVLAVIALLLALLIPALARARSVARTAVCASSMRQVHHQFVMYANDFQGAWPVVSYDRGSEWVTWMYFLARYDDALDEARSPAQVLAPATPSERHSVHWGCPEWVLAAGDTGYGMNDLPLADPGRPYLDSLDGGGMTWARIFQSPHVSGRFFKVTEWTRPSEKALLSDSWGPAWASGAGTWPFLAGEDEELPTVITPRDPRSTLDWIRHSGGRLPKVTEPSMNVLYVDGHVKKVSFLEAYRAHYAGDPASPPDPMPRTSW